MQVDLERAVELVRSALTVGKSLKAVAVAMLLMGCSSAPSSQARPPAFEVEQVFAGRSEGRGTLKLFLGSERPFIVESSGALQADGSFRLDQSVRFEGKPVQSRHWIMRRIDASRYAISLSDAAGPVTARTDERRLLLRYPLNRRGLVMQQTLELSPEGKTIANHGRISFLGIPVGRLRETIQLQR
jgi:hypothetical protein